MTGVLVRGAEVDGRLCDVRVRGGIVVGLGARLARESGEEVVEARGGALLPGLTDHHLHLFASAAAFASVECGGRGVEALRSAVPDRWGWIRGVGYDGDLDGAALDALRGEVPVRVQHRSGALWVLNSRAGEAVGLAGADHPGVERDAEGRPTGRLWRADGWLRERLPREAPPSLAEVGRRLARYGITGVTDATPRLSADTVAALAEERASGRLPQRLLMLGAPLGTGAAGTHTPSAARTLQTHPLQAHAPWKIVLPDSALPALPDLVAEITEAHLRARPVAVHTVTDVSLALLLAALQQAGPLPGDRLEHAALVPESALGVVRGLGLSVVTQPGFLADRGDVFLDGTPAGQHGCLYRCASFLAAGVGVALSSDAPYGPLDPWAVMRAAVERRAPDGRVVGAGERVSGARALAGYLARSPGAAPARVVPGVAADLVLLRVPLAEALSGLSAEFVRRTFIAGQSSDVW
ncbi:amidohydrolase family protein [Streptomyces sp. NPDC004539]|uniref:amidohydrolase family protein n=1 Tax=Streptomyces sp. NPDC004539 TaxID=3154280 RepID=UPI0033ABDAFE